VLDHAYGAVKQAALHRAAHNGAVVRECSIPLPCRKGSDAIVGALDQAITPRTRLAILDQITSPSALLLPIEAMIRVCNERSVPVLVDGAHAPGMLDKPAKLDGATWWTGNLHKWLGAPKGCAVLSVQASTKAAQQPPVVSHGYQESFEAAFDWQGTRDLAPWLTAPFAITFWDRYGGIDRVRDHNHTLVVGAQAMLLDRFGTEPLSPEDGSMLGSMATLPLPAAIAGHSELENPEDLNQLLAARFKVEVPVFDIKGQWHVRISAQVYNELDDYLRLADAIETLLGESG
jgi:isopenicillin-N epimerase